MILVTPLGVALSGCRGSGSNDTNAMLLPDRIDDWVRQDSPATYDRETIFDYIDGAGEVYRSYAFADVAVARYTRPGEPEVTVEIFDMGNPDDAYGVFSYAREQEDSGIGGGFERKGSVLCFWQDRFYVCVAAEQLATDDGGVLEDIARQISQSLPPASARPALLQVLPDEGRVALSDRFFHLHQTLNYHYYLARENVLELDANTDAVLARYRPGSTYVIAAAYPDEGAANSALASFKRTIMPGAGDAETVEAGTGTFTSAARHGRFVVVVLDAVSSDAADTLRMAATARVTQLAP
jgi:hypothetical protein